MFVTFHASAGKKFDDAIAAHFLAGCRLHGHRVACVPTAAWDGTPDPRADVGVVVGVKDKSGPIFQAYRKAGRHAVFVDKGYARIRGGDLGTLYWRVSVDDFQPLSYFRAGRPPDRWDALGVEVADDRVRGENVLFAGSSQKFCTWHGLGDATAYAEAVLAKLRAYTDRPIVYRPKPSWVDKVEIPGFGYSPPEEKFQVELANAHCLVTYGSNACFEALVRGVPTVVLGNGITRDLGGTACKQVADPPFPKRGHVRKLAHDVAYCQWTLEEMAAGTCWADVATHLKGKT